MVKTLETQFRERWTDPAGTEYAFVAQFGASTNVDAFLTASSAVLISDPGAINSGGDSGSLIPLAALDPQDDAIAQLPDSPGVSSVQMWRTIPVRKSRGKSPSIFPIGEFSNLSGIANACSRASQLIWIFDQYFWSRPLASLLNSLLQANAQLCVIIILPPYYNSIPGWQRYLRNLAFFELTNNVNLGVFRRLGVYNLWHKGLNQGIYCHAKAQIYDKSLLVCGSCNLNQRSFLCDTELDCAVYDPDLVASHQAALWQLLFPNIMPIKTLSTEGSSINFLEAFKQAVISNGSFLICDRDFYSPPPLTLPGSDVIIQRAGPPGGWLSPDGWVAPPPPGVKGPSGWVDPPPMSKVLGEMANFFPDPTSLAWDNLGTSNLVMNSTITLQELSELLTNDPLKAPVWRIPSR